MLHKFPLIASNLSNMPPQERQLFWIRVLREDISLDNCERLLGSTRARFSDILNVTGHGALVNDLNRSMQALSTRILSFSNEANSDPVATQKINAFTALGDKDRLTQYDHYKTELNGKVSALDRLTKLHEESADRALNAVAFIQYYIDTAMTDDFSPVDQYHFLKTVGSAIISADTNGKYLHLPSSQARAVVMNEFCFIMNELGRTKQHQISTQFLELALGEPAALCNSRNKLNFLFRLKKDTDNRKWDELTNMLGFKKSTPEEIASIRTTLNDLCKTKETDEAAINQLFNKTKNVLFAERGRFSHSDETLETFNQYKTLWTKINEQPLRSLSSSNSNNNNNNSSRNNVRK